MNFLPLIQHLPHALSAAHPNDGQLALLAGLVGIALSLKLSMARQQARVRREKFIRERQSLRASPLRQDNEPR